MTRVNERELQIVERLCLLSREHTVALGQGIDWPSERDPEAWYTSPELISVHGSDVATKLSVAQLKELAFLEAVNFFSLNIYGEKFLLSGIAARLHRKDFFRTSSYLHHFLDEENKHLYYFATFCERYAGKIYPHGEAAFPRQYAPGEEDFLFFAKILCFEEVVDYFNQRMANDERLASIARSINRLHHLDETRHLAFGRLLVKDLFAAHAPAWSADTVASVRSGIRAFVEAMWRKYYNPAVYLDARLVEPYAVADVAFGSEAARRLRAEATRKCFTFFVQNTILEDGTLL